MSDHCVKSNLLSAITSLTGEDFLKSKLALRGPVFLYVADRFDSRFQCQGVNVFFIGLSIFSLTEGTVFKGRVDCDGYTDVSGGTVGL